MTTWFGTNTATLRWETWRFPPPTRYSDTPHDPDYEHNEAEQQHRRRKGSWHAPDIGEHSAEVLSEIGFSDAEVERLTAAGGAVPPAAGSWARANL